MTKFLVWFILLFCIFYDVACELFGWPTISGVVREIDAQTGCLFRWTVIALWCHWFVAWGWKAQ